MSKITDFTATTADWRGQLQCNQRRTRWVIAMFILLYLAIGFSVDLYLVSGASENFLAVLQALLTFHRMPFATLIMLVVAAVSLLVTYALYDRLMLLGTDHYEVTPETARTIDEKQLYNVVEEMKVAAGLHFMPKIYVIEAEYMNAFASGYSERSAMVAITRGLIEKLNRNELQAVMAHELSHIRHQDIKLTLTASILSNLIIIVVDLLFRGLIFGRNRRVDPRLLLAITILRFILPIITVLLLLYLSRTREYMADAGCVELMRDNTPLGTALLKIHNDHRSNQGDYKAAYGSTAHEEVRRAAYLYDPRQAGISTMRSISDLFSTHPSLEQRLAALGFSKKM